MKIEKKEICPHCGAPITINFSEEEIKGNGSKDVICQACNGRSYYPAGIGKPIFFPLATEQDGRTPRVLRA